MGFIYKIWNEINDKVYIGQTTTSLQQRWKEHHYACHSIRHKNQHLYLAMRKYGEKFFHIEEVEQCENILLNEREIYWIDFFDSYNQGYNMTLGGENSATAKGLTKKQVQWIWDLWDEGLSITDIIRITNFTTAQVRNRLEGYCNYNIEESERRGRETARKSKCKAISQWTLQGDFIATYQSGIEAEEKTGINRKAISKVLQKKSKTSGGFLWTFEGELPIIENQREQIYQYDKENNLINTFSSCAEAARQTGLDSSTISKVCRGKLKSTGGFYWERK